MTTIDELNGRDLDVAVARALGLRDIQYSELRGEWLYRPERYADGKGRLAEIPCYSADIALAWELDGDGWEWSIEECITRAASWLHIRVYDNRRERGPYMSSAYFSDYPTKAAAYATARCRVWLKAQELSEVQ